MTVSMPRDCTGCEVLPLGPPSSGTLYLAPPLAHTLGVIKSILHRRAHKLDESIPGAIAIAVPEGHLPELVESLAAALTGPELEATPVLLMDPKVTPSIANFLRARPLARLVAQVRGAWLATMIADDRLETHFQPIVVSTRPGELFAYECLSRGIDLDGALVFPGTLYPVATAAGLLYYLDRATRIRAIRSAAAQQLSPYVFINFSPTSIYNPDFCLRSTARAAADAGLSPDRVVFEVVESEEIHDTDHLLAILKVYRDAGFLIALDDLGAGYGSLNLLHRLRPDFVKLDIGLVRDVHADPFKGAIAAKLLEAASQIGIRTVAEGVETAEEWAWLRDHGADYQQGYLFAYPAASPPRPRDPSIAHTGSATSRTTG